MYAVRFHAYGPPSELRVDEVADAVPTDGGVVVRVRTVGVNHWDVDMRNGSSGLELRLPHTPGLETAGDVAAIGPGVTGWSVGDRVMLRFVWPCRHCERCAAHQENHCTQLRMPGATDPGGYSEYVAAPASELVRLPDGVSYEDGAALQCTYGPVWHALKSRLQLAPGATILINAAGSGVGSAGIQLAKLLRAQIIASAGSDDKLATAKAEGAEATVNYRTDDLAQRVRELTGGKGVQAVLDCVGGHILEASLAALAPTGRAVSLGAHAGASITVDLASLFRAERSIIGSANCTPSDIDTVMGLLAEKKIRPNVYKTYPLENAALAHAELEARRHYGKLLLMPYEKALVANNVPVREDRLTDTPGALRTDGTAMPGGDNEISSFGRSRSIVPLRMIERSHLRSAGKGAVFIMAESVYADGGTGAQSQLWIRRSQEWRVSVAHAVTALPVHRPGPVPGTGEQVPIETAPATRTASMPGILPNLRACARLPDGGRPLTHCPTTGLLTRARVGVKELSAIAGERIGAGIPQWPIGAVRQLRTALDVQAPLGAEAETTGSVRTRSTAICLVGASGGGCALLDVAYGRVVCAA